MRGNWSINKWIGRTALGLLILLIVLALAFIWWAKSPREAMPEVINGIESNQNVLVNSEDWMVFMPNLDTSLMGIILYPGGHVDPRAYAPMANDLALAGYFVIIPRMPLNLAVFGIHIADDIISAYPDIESWVIGGHSLGGAMAVEYVSANPSNMDGLFLWASYFAKSKDLSDFNNLEVLMLYGSEDSDIEKIRDSRERLPPNTSWYEIEGGNHAQFGWYGRQPGDGIASISRETQQELVIEHTLMFLNELKSRSRNRK